MDKVKVLFSNGKEVEVDRSAKLSQAMEKAGIKKDFPCGGLGRCGQCKTEVDFLKSDGRKEINTVLACTFTLDEDILVKLTGDGEEFNPLILTSGSQTSEKADSAVVKIFVNVETGLEKIKSHWGRMRQKLTETGANHEPSLEILQQYAFLDGSRKEKGFTAVSVNGKMIGLERGDTTGSCYGLAIDVETTLIF